MSAQSAHEIVNSVVSSCVRYFTMFLAELKRFVMILHISQHGLGVIHGKRRQRPTFKACLNRSSLAPPPLANRHLS